MPESSVGPPTVESPPRVGAGRRTSLVTFDQGMSSASNLLMLIWVAHALPPADFGWFSLVFLVYMVTQNGLVRSLVSATIVVHPEDADDRPRSVLGAAVLLSLGVGTLCAAAGALLWSLGSDVGPPMLLTGALMPLLGVQDVGRYLGIAQSRPGRALMLDSLWLVFILCGYAVVSLTDAVSLMSLVACWAGAGATSGLWVFVQHGAPRARELSLDWIRQRWHFSWRVMVASTSSGIVALVGSSLMTLVSGPLSVAAVRASLTLEQPCTMVQIAVATSAAADIAREQPDNTGVLRRQRSTMLISFTVSAFNLAVLLLIPDALGRLVLGRVWDVVSPLLLLVGLHVMATAASSGVRAALMGRRDVRPVMTVDITGTVLSVVGVVVGAAVGDGEGAMWGLVIGQALTAVAWWAVFVRHLAAFDRTWSSTTLDNAVP